MSHYDIEASSTCTDTLGVGTGRLPACTRRLKLFIPGLGMALGSFRKLFNSSKPLTKRPKTSDVDSSPVALRATEKTKTAKPGVQASKPSTRTR